MESFQDRKLELGQKVRVYVNLHKGGMFSIVDMKTGLVCGYANNCLVSNAILYSSESGRKRVRETKQKLVHAWVRGIFQGADIEASDLDDPLEYNPYVHEGFTNTAGQVIEQASMAFLCDKKVYVKRKGNDNADIH